MRCASGVGSAVMSCASSVGSASGVGSAVVSSTSSVSCASSVGGATVSCASGVGSDCGSDLIIRVRCSQPMIRF